MATPADFLAQAVKLLAEASGDMDYRGAIVDAYYGAYHAALEFEERLPHRSQANTESTGSHDALIQRLERPHHQLDYGLRIICQDIGAQMRMLKPLREIASYELKETVRVDQAEQAIQAAKDVMAECDRGRNKLRANQSP